MALLDGILFIGSVLVGIAMLLTLLVPFVQPSRIFFFPLLGLIAPVIFVLTVVLALYWIIRWRWIRAGLLIGLVLIGWYQVPLFYRMQFRRAYDEVKPAYGKGTFRLVTLNVRGFYSDLGHNSADRVAEFLTETDPDIVCLQEYHPDLAHRSASFNALLERYGAVCENGRSDAGEMIILSKFPILGAETLPDSDCSLWADLKIGEDTVRIFSNHLHTTQIKAYDEAFLTQRILTDSTRWAKMRSIIHRHRKNSELRAAQVDSIAPVIAATQGRRIVCGDFNDTPVSYVYRTMAQGSKDAFSSCGTGYSHTFRGFLNALRIDYVLYSRGLEALAYEVPDLTASDHLPVVVQLQKTEL